MAETSLSPTGGLRHEHRSYHYRTAPYLQRRRCVPCAQSLWDWRARRRFGARFDCHHSALARRWDGCIWSARVTPLRRRLAKPTACQVVFGLYYFLLQWCVRQPNSRPRSGGGVSRVPLPRSQVEPQLSAKPRRAWAQALDYRREVGADERLFLVKQLLFEFNFRQADCDVVMGPLII